MILSESRSYESMLREEYTAKRRSKLYTQCYFYLCQLLTPDLIYVERDVELIRKKMINKPFETAIKNILSYQKIYINFDIVYNELYRQPFFQKKKKPSNKLKLFKQQFHQKYLSLNLSLIKLLVTSHPPICYKIIGSSIETDKKMEKQFIYVSQLVSYMCDES